MNVQFFPTLLLTLMFAYSQLVSIPVMSANLGDVEAMSMVHASMSVVDASMAQMQDCIGMNMSDENLCPHSDDSSCCAHVCSSSAVTSSSLISPRLKFFSEKLVFADQNKPSPWSKDPLPPPKL